MLRIATLLTSLLCITSAAALGGDPARIDIITIMSGPTADRGQSEQYGAELALSQVKKAGGVLGRPVEAFYADNACKPDIGVPVTRRLIEQQRVPVIIGALCTPVPHAIEPVVQGAKIPLARLAPASGITVTAQETLTKDMTDLASVAGQTEGWFAGCTVDHAGIIHRRLLQGL
jgi:ABC-type branched-subunit amino acid transport system substrate-binding protein